MLAGLALAAASAVTASLPLPPLDVVPVRAPAHVRAAKPRPHRQKVDIRAVQLRLIALHYDPGPADGVYSGFTQDAVWAFEEVNGLPPTGKPDDRLVHALAHPKAPRRLTHDSSRAHVDVDIRHQILVVYKDGKVALISHVSTGSGQHYCKDGRCGFARTPRGDFRVTRRFPGWHRSRLGYMYRPLYFYSGFAIHGSLDVPREPASHGCVRIPMHTADLVPGLVRNGEPVHIH
ncbi:L,D-transpeptidase family protein [Actinomadura rupiterrae]|uniref:L,D-transpeptidase family protein n=1 Tax=Actinomadura rupiterrae TaxID=559627 RepID=UPI0020A5D59F|nr:L,D-transpeptidase family protein [Actinomadura rupiterrae]MCP2340129.1 lipoprotein-anchoring transpeptidase ErfK/SrfK [Actinomadura rupiterrae]